MKFPAAEHPPMHELLGQREHWITSDDRVIPLPELGVRHAQNIRKWLLKNAWKIQLAADWNFTAHSGGSHGDAAQDALDSIAAEFGEDPQEWMRGQPLFEELTLLLTMPEDRLTLRDLQRCQTAIQAVMAATYPAEYIKPGRLRVTYNRITRILAELGAQRERGIRAKGGRP